MPVLHVGAADSPLRRVGGEGHATVALADGLHPLRVPAGAGGDAIGLPVRSAAVLPPWLPAYAPGRECHRIGAWPERGILGTRLGPNADGGVPS